MWIEKLKKKKECERQTEVSKGLRVSGLLALLLILSLSWLV